MSARREFVLCEADLEEIKRACAPRPLMFLSGGMPMGPSAQESANAAWCALGRRMGFDGMTVKPVPGKGPTFFTAVPAPVVAEETKAADVPQEVRSMGRYKATIVLALAGSFEAKTVPVEIEAKDVADARTQLERRARVEQGVARDCGEKSARAVYLIGEVINAVPEEKGVQPA